MEWYWWALIAVGVVLAGMIKLKVWNAIKKNRAEKQRDIEEADE
jgi:hypothetical protein